MGLIILRFSKAFVRQIEVDKFNLPPNRTVCDTKNAFGMHTHTKCVI